MVECAICGQQGEVITWKHLAKHKLTLAEYKHQFPNAPIKSEEALARKKAGARRANADRKGVARSAEVIQKMKAAKADNPREAWNKGVARTAEENQHLSKVRTARFASGEIVHWNTGRTTGAETKTKIRDTALSQNRTYAEESKAKRRITMQAKIADGWVKKTTYEMTPEHYEAWQAGAAISIKAKIDQAIEKAAAICTVNNISVISVSQQSYLYQLQCNQCHHEFSRTRNAFIDSKVDANAFKCPICFPRSTLRSKAEIELCEFIKSVLPEHVEIKESDRTVLNGREIDCYIPELNIGFEYNGLYWHSERVSGKQPYWHNWKTKLAATKRVRLITIFEDEWLTKREIVCSRIMHLLGNHTNRRTIFARKTAIKRITLTEKDQFLADAHIQGTDKSAICYGAWYQDQLIAVMTFTAPNLSKGQSEQQFELNRFALGLNIHSPGIASRLFAQFIKDYQPKSVVSYADRRWCTGEVYTHLGFKFDSTSPPSYWYLINNYTARLHRANFMKHTLEKKLELFDPDKTEWENMIANGYDRIWDCGTNKFVYDLEDSMQ